MRVERLRWELHVTKTSVVPTAEAIADGRTPASAQAEVRTRIRALEEQLEDVELQLLIEHARITDDTARAYHAGGGGVCGARGRRPSPTPRRPIAWSRRSRS